MRQETGRGAAFASVVACLLLAASGHASAQAVRYEHRVVVPTTSLDRELDVEGSLARNVNRLAAVGFEVSAIVGGHGTMVDRLLERKPYVAGQVDHGGHVMVIMHRVIGRPSPPREYRFLHTRTPMGVEPIVAGYARDGFRLRTTASEGVYFHAAFERVDGDEAFEYRVLRTARRRGWDAQIGEDADVRLRVRRAVPITLDAALVELGPPATTPAAFAWETDKTHQRSRLQDRLRARAASGFRVQVVRMRGTDLDIGLLKPAGADGPGPAVTLEDGPWGGPCSRGRIVGADVFTDGDVYCVAEDPGGPVASRGFDLVVSPQSSLGNQLLFGRPSCEVQARLASTRPAALRSARAVQLEQELNRRVEPGYRVTRAFIGAPESGDPRIVIFASTLPAEPAPAGSAASGPAPRLWPDLDQPGQQILEQRERTINDALAQDTRLRDVNVWAEISEGRGASSVLLTGCARQRVDRDLAETVLRGLLARTPYASYRIRNEVIIDLLP